MNCSVYAVQFQCVFVRRCMRKPTLPVSLFVKIVKCLSASISLYSFQFCMSSFVCLMFSPPPVLQGDLIVICNTGDRETQSYVDKSIAVPCTIDCLQGILTIIPLQLLSLHIAEKRKCDVSMQNFQSVIFFLLHGLYTRWHAFYSFLPPQKGRGHWTQTLDRFNNKNFLTK